MRKLSPGRLLFAAAVAASLSAGAQSAFARPAAPARDAEAVCYSGICYRECRDNGWASGGCVNGYCECR